MHTITLPASDLAQIVAYGNTLYTPAKRSRGFIAISTDSRGIHIAARFTDVDIQVCAFDGAFPNAAIGFDLKALAALAKATGKIHIACDPSNPDRAQVRYVVRGQSHVADVATIATIATYTAPKAFAPPKGAPAIAWDARACRELRAVAAFCGEGAMTRYAWNGVLIDGASGDMAATDGRALALSRAVVGSFGDGKRVIAPVAPFAHKLLCADWGASVGDDGIYFSLPGWLIRVRGIEGVFPRYWRDVIPAAHFADGLLSLSTADVRGLLTQSHTLEVRDEKTFRLFCEQSVTPECASEWGKVCDLSGSDYIGPKIVGEFAGPLFRPALAFAQSTSAATVVALFGAPYLDKITIDDGRRVVVAMAMGLAKRKPGACPRGWKNVSPAEYVVDRQPIAAGALATA
jgi:hypothetical protein